MENDKQKPEGPPLDPEKLYNIEQLALSLGMSPHTLRKKAREGDIPSIKRFGKFFFLGKEVIKNIVEKGAKKG